MDLLRAIRYIFQASEMSGNFWWGERGEWCGREKKVIRS